jgi:hypothetical protein
MKFAPAFALAATLSLGAFSAQASTVIFHQTGVGNGHSGVGVDIAPTGGDYRVDVTLSRSMYFEIWSQYGYAHREYDISNGYREEIGANEATQFDGDGWISDHATFFFHILPPTSVIYGNFEDVHFPFDAFVSVDFLPFASAPDSGSGPYSYDVRIIDLAAVPEPATWTVMLLGFFGVGTILRRGGRYLAAAPAC